MRCQGSQMSVGSPNASNRRLAAAESRKIWAASACHPPKSVCGNQTAPFPSEIAPVPPKSDSTAAR